MRVRTCELAFDIRCDHLCGKKTNVDVFVSAVARVDMFVIVVALHVCELPMLDGATT